MLKPFQSELADNHVSFDKSSDPCVSFGAKSIAISVSSSDKLLHRSVSHTAIESSESFDTKAIDSSVSFGDKSTDRSASVGVTSIDSRALPRLAGPTLGRT